MFFKSAKLKADIIPITHTASQNGNLTKLAGRWADLNSFPDRYKQLFANYKRANDISVGQYNPEFKYYRVIALHGDAPNDNGDFWHFGSKEDPTQPELLRYDDSIQKPVYSTFVGRGNYKNHENDDVTKAVGVILDAAPNHEGKLIEALLAVDSVKDPELVRGIESGYIDSVSMGCLCAYSICSICNNTATNESEYCDHIKYYKGRTINHQGSMVPVYEDNRGVNFIELSWVTVPADPHAKLLERVASYDMSLSENHKIIYQAMQQSFNDAKTIAKNAEEYMAYVNAIKQAAIDSIL
jgi:hypothetical protein